MRPVRHRAVRSATKGAKKHMDRRVLIALAALVVILVVAYAGGYFRSDPASTPNVTPAPTGGGTTTTP